MIGLAILGLLAFVAAFAVLMLLKRDWAKYPIFLIGFLFLAIQTAYLLLVVFDKTPGSEVWMGLALTYIPLSITFFLLLTILSIARMLKEKTAAGRLKSVIILPVYGICSYFILSLWGDFFGFPL